MSAVMDSSRIYAMATHDIALGQRPCSLAVSSALLRLLMRIDYVIDWAVLMQLHRMHEPGCLYGSPP